ncbi:MAG: type VI secretion system-associated FHA domain protein TagH [Pseudomonas qingdaonensis]|uniref:type VI secretion system-associated FHA domain protein TagH n=1 Tax=Pseudomonas qingdaonensis TaxID=2056231 RepID=UPI003314CED7
MELVLETQGRSKTFTRAGGVIGRDEACDWVISDPQRHVSKRHALVTCQEGVFFLTDISSNGTRDGRSGAQLRKGQAQRIEQDSVYLLGGFEVRARLVTRAAADVEVGLPSAAGSIIPDDAFLELDPFHALDQQDVEPSPLDALSALDTVAPVARQRPDYARIDMESLLVPNLVAQPEPDDEPQAPPAPACNERFWAAFGTALGVDLGGLDPGVREALAIKAAGLLKQSIGGVQQSLRTRSELKNELRLALTTSHRASHNPLKSSADAGQALGLLLHPAAPGQLPASQALTQAYRDLQAHQVAMLTACRAALQGVLEHFSPRQLGLQFERGRAPLLRTAGSQWRAYVRYHHALGQDDEWSERLLARDFAQAYAEQVRLIGTLHTDAQG